MKYRRALGIANGRFARKSAFTVRANSKLKLHVFMDHAYSRSRKSISGIL